MSRNGPVEPPKGSPSRVLAPEEKSCILRAWSYTENFRPWLKGWLEILQSVLTIVGILAAATYATRMTTALTIESRELTGSDYCLYSALIKVTNSGFAPISVHRASVRVERILPLDEQIRSGIKQKHLAHRDSEKTLVDWPMVDERIKDPELTLYPGDTDSVLFDIVVPCAVKVMRLHSTVSVTKNLLPGTAIWTQDELVNAPVESVIGNKER